MVYDGVQKVLVRRFYEDDVGDEGGGLLGLPVAQEGGVANSDAELFGARVLKSTEDLCEVSVVN